MLARADVAPDRFAIDLACQRLEIAVTVRGAAIELQFDESWPRHKKAVLLRSLIAKKFEPLIPRLRIKLSRKP